MEVDEADASSNSSHNQNRNVWGINPNNTSSSSLRKRPVENQSNGVDGNIVIGDQQEGRQTLTSLLFSETGPSSKRRQLAPTGLLSAKSHELYGISGIPKGGLVSNGKPKVATITRIGGRKQMINWVDAPDDVFFIATDLTRYVFQ